MWADTATNPAPLDLGHGSIEHEEDSWSPWLSCKDTVKDLELYKTVDNLKRPVEMRIATGFTTDFLKDTDDSQLENKRFLSKFDNLPQAIEYLNHEATREARHAQAAENFITKLTTSTQPITQAPTTTTTTWHWPAVRRPAAREAAHAAAVREQERPPSQPQPPWAEPAGTVGREKLKTPPHAGTPISEASEANRKTMPIPAVLGYVGYLGFLPCFACVGYLSYRLVKRRCSACSPPDDTSAGEEASSGAEETLDAMQPNTWQAFMGSSNDGEFRRLLFYAEQQGRFPPIEDLPLIMDANGESQSITPADRVTAEAEVERILAISNPRDLFGSGGPNEKKQEYWRLVRLLHPDKGLIDGERANLALRRVVEAYRSLNLDA